MLLDIAFLDDATRPHAPKLTGLTPAQKEGGAHLRMIHDHLRQNMEVLRELIEEAAGGRATAEDVNARTSGLEMLDNFRRFGSLCGRYCQFVHGHHSLEDEAVFPPLALQSEGLRKVTERLQAEHVVVHELLVRLIDALNALARFPSSAAFDDARTIYDALERVLLSHLGYEEDEIGDALGYYGVL